MDGWMDIHTDPKNYEVKEATTVIEFANRLVLIACFILGEIPLTENRLESFRNSEERFLC